MWWTDTGFDGRALLKRLVEREAAMRQRAPQRPQAARPASPARGGSRAATPIPGEAKSAAAPGAASKGTAGKAAGAGKAAAGAAAAAKPAALPPPSQRLSGVCMSVYERSVAEDLAGRLLAIPAASNAAALLSR